mgnify:CR=1 FL=1
MFELADIKNYLWISYNDDDVKLTQIKLWVESLLIKHLWNISLWDRIIQIENKEIKNETFFIPLVNPLKIKDINWTDFTSKVNWVDYFIKNDWNVIIKDLLDYTDNDFWVFKVTIEAWFAEIPDWIFAVVAEYIWFLSTLDNGRAITNETMWPRQTSFTGLDSQNALKNFISKISLYLPTGLTSYIV